MSQNGSEADHLVVLESLANGLDPFSQGPLPKDSIIHNPAVIRALFKALNELRLLAETTDEHVEKRTATHKKSRPTRAGRPWSADVDRNLIKSFRSRLPFHQIAEDHNSTKGAIISRLVRIGEIEPRPLAELSDRDQQSPTDHNDWKKD